MKKARSLVELIPLAVSPDRPDTVECSFSIEVEGETWQVYEASLAHRDILLFTDKGTATYVVDTYGDKHAVELFDWDTDKGE